VAYIASLSLLEAEILEMLAIWSVINGSGHFTHQSRKSTSQRL
jgi:hypothetical protein